MYIVYYGKFKGFMESKKFIDWFLNEENMRNYKAAFTEGMKLVDIYFPILGTADHDVEMWMEVDNWAVLDKDRDNLKMKEVLL